MKREIISTSDGSSTIYLPDWNEYYHSKHGAIQEANHVFIDKALTFYSATHKKTSLSILEVGFGTGLNALLTLLFAEEHHINITYTGVEGFPVPANEFRQLNYVTELCAVNYETQFHELHTCAWEQMQHITPYFRIEKQQKKFSDINDELCFDIIYFDAFGPRVQPELWTITLFKRMYKALRHGGVLTTYCAQGAARRHMIASGFEVEKLQGPPGKREMLRALKK